VPPASAAELPPGEAARVWAGLERADADPLVVDLSLRALAAAARRAPLIYVLCSWVRIDYMASDYFAGSRPARRLRQAPNAKRSAQGWCQPLTCQKQPA